MTDVFSHSTLMICLLTLLVCHNTKKGEKYVHHGRVQYI